MRFLTGPALLVLTVALLAALISESTADGQTRSVAVLALMLAVGAGGALLRGVSPVLAGLVLLAGAWQAWIQFHPSDDGYDLIIVAPLFVLQLAVGVLATVSSARRYRHQT